MKIELEEPYKSIYKAGYIVINKENRRMVLLSSRNGKQTTTSYARYLYSVKLGYLVPDDLQVDHINDDCTDDYIDNFQLLTPEQNREKEIQRYRDQVQVRHNIICNNCGKSFVLTDRQIKMKQKTNTKNYYCNRECFIAYAKKNFTGNQFNYSGIKSAVVKKQIIIDKIKDLRKLNWSSPRIAKELNIARNTVMKYWGLNNNTIEVGKRKGVDIVIIDNSVNTISIYNSLVAAAEILGLPSKYISRILSNKESIKYKNFTIKKLSTHLKEIQQVEISKFSSPTSIPSPTSATQANVGDV